ncbi:hypothetical protein PoB_005164800 [Plakobranchus ocellatus]|uniref:Uncharacterized protein n=1 Tax=Plakobranchus ocellatus TaxID=259542 RepID=A0AAV4C142_9GAST|nr:hypothetical protein PoB_005164800 [Plakobranchus ocellatus]
MQTTKNTSFHGYPVLICVLSSVNYDTADVSRITSPQPTGATGTATLASGSLARRSTRFLFTILSACEVDARRPVFRVIVSRPRHQHIFNITVCALYLHLTLRMTRLTMHQC